MKTPREVLLSRHRDIEPKLERMWTRITARPAVAPYQLFVTFWRELIWPCRRIWAGLACTWVLIIAAHLASSQPSTQVAGKTTPPSREEMQALAEQRRMLAQLIGEEPKPTNKRQLASPGQHSEGARRISVA
jgi:hypothetical protein